MGIMIGFGHDLALGSGEDPKMEQIANEWNKFCNSGARFFLCSWNKIKLVQSDLNWTPGLPRYKFWLTFSAWVLSWKRYAHPIKIRLEKSHLHTKMPSYQVTETWNRPGTNSSKQFQTVPKLNRKRCMDRVNGKKLSVFFCPFFSLPLKLGKSFGLFAFCRSFVA